MLNTKSLELLSGKQNIIGELNFGIVTKGLYCGTPDRLINLQREKDNSRGD